MLVDIHYIFFTKIGVRWRDANEAIKNHVLYMLGERP